MKSQKGKQDEKLTVATSLGSSYSPYHVPGHWPAEQIVDRETQAEQPQMQYWHKRSFCWKTISRICWHPGSWNSVLPGRCGLEALQWLVMALDPSSWWLAGILSTVSGLEVHCKQSKSPHSWPLKLPNDQSRPSLKKKKKNPPQFGWLLSL